MNNKFLKRLLPALFALVMVFTLIPVNTVKALDNSDFDNYIRELAQLVENTWSDLFISVVEFRIDDPEMTVDGKTFIIDPVNGATPYLSDEGRTMLPIGVLIDLLDLDVEFDSTSFAITIEGPDVRIDLAIDSDTITVNGRSRHLDSPPVIRNGRTYIPAGAVAESLLFDAEWIPEGRRVILTRPFQTGRLIVRTDGSTPSFDNLSGVVGTLRGPNGEFILQFSSERAAQEASEQLENNQSVMYSSPDLIMSTTAVYRSWGVERIAADRYQSYLTPSARNLPQVIVAVLDTGVDASHPFLAGRLVPGWNFVNNNNNPRDGHGHGTHVSGTIAESTLSNVKIMPIKVLADNGSGCSLNIDAGIRYAADNGANIINMSLGGPGVSPSTREAIQYANSKNVVVVVAAGNDNRDAAGFSPANIPEAITVAACDNRDQKATFSNFGNGIDVSAPGVDITSSIPGGGFDTWNGTSMAAPHVAAAVALLKSDVRYAGLYPAALATTLRTLTDDAGAPGYDTLFGHGIVNLSKAGLSDTPATPVTITWDYNGGTGSPPSSSLTSGTNFGTLPVPNARTGYTFGGWFSTRDATGGVQITGTSTVPNSNTTYWARWIVASNSYTLTPANPSATVNVGSGSAGRVAVTITAPANGSVSLQSSNITSGNDPVLYNAGGSTIADDEAGNFHFIFTVPAGQTMTVYAGTYTNTAAVYTITATFPSTSPGAITLTQSNPSATVNVGSGSTGRVPITITAPSTSSVTIQSSNAASGVDPTLYNASGAIIADDDGCNLHFRYTIPAGQTMTVFAGTYENSVASYTVTATFPSPGSGAITLTLSNPSATVTVGTGSAGRVPITVTAPATGSVTIQSSNITSGSDPALFNASGTIIADDEAGNWHFRYIIPAGQTMTVYAGSFGDSRAVYTVTATFPGNSPGTITLTPGNPSTSVNVGAGVNGRVPITITAPANRSIDIVSSRTASLLIDPTLYNASGTIIADDEAGLFNFRYTIPAGQTVTVYAGTYADSAATYTVTANF